MRVSDEIRMWIGVLVFVQVVSAFGAIQLLTRMSPAIERILEENVYSIQAVEDMLACLALTDVTEAERETRFSDALDRARNNVTEPDEVQVLDEVHELRHRTFAGDHQSRSRLVSLLNGLGEINRRSMRNADERAKRLGSAGAWAAVFLGLSGFAISVLAVRRLRRRLLAPLTEIHDVVQAFRAGDPFRRFSMRGAPPELAEVGSAVNELLERRWSRQVETAGELAALDRAALLHIVDGLPEAVLVADRRGAIAAANRAGREAMDGERGTQLRQAVLRLAHGQPSATEGARVEELPGHGWLWILPEEQGGGEPAQ